MKCLDYLNRCITKHPTLFASSSLHTAYLKVLDQLLNVIGNGIRDDEELVLDIESLNDISIPENIAEFASSDFFWGYTTTELYSSSSIVVREQDKDKYPHIVRWINAGDCKSSFKPYPNFSKRYSVVWRCPHFCTLGKDWIEWALIFYNECRGWFHTSDARYHHAFPREYEYKTNYSLKSFKKYIEKYNNDHDAISKAYNLEYTGDDYNFLCQRWKKDRKKIHIFLYETITMLETKLLEET